MSFLISNAMAANNAAQAQGNPFGSIAILVVFLLLMYFVMVRPQRQQQKAQQELVSSLANDDEVMTNGGILGVIKEVDDNFVDLQVAKEVTIKVQKGAIVKSFPKGTLRFRH